MNSVVSPKGMTDKGRQIEAKNACLGCGKMGHKKAACLGTGNKGGKTGIKKDEKSNLDATDRSNRIKCRYYCKMGHMEKQCFRKQRLESQSKNQGS